MNYLSLSTVSLSDLKDKVVVVFGGSRVTGSNIIKKAELEGANVFSFSRLDGFDISSASSVVKALSIVER